MNASKVKASVYSTPEVHIRASILSDSMHLETFKMNVSELFLCAHRTSSHPCFPHLKFVSVHLSVALSEISFKERKKNMHILDIK